MDTEIMEYKMKDSNPKMIIDVIINLILKMLEAYIIKYPNPFLDTKSSPIITPIKFILRFIFKVLIIFGRLLWIIIFW